MSTTTSSRIFFFERLKTIFVQHGRPFHFSLSLIARAVFDCFTSAHTSSFEILTRKCSNILTWIAKNKIQMSAHPQMERTEQLKVKIKSEKNVGQLDEVTDRRNIITLHGHITERERRNLPMLFNHFIHHNNSILKCKIFASCAIKSSCDSFIRKTQNKTLFNNEAWTSDLYFNLLDGFSLHDSKCYP